MLDVTVLDRGNPAAPPSPVAAAAASSRVRYVVLAVLEAAAAAVGLLTGTTFHDLLPTWLRVGLVFAGLYLGYLAIGHAAQAIAGRRVDVLFGLCIGWLA